jgi:hypothetical protein
MKKLRLVLVLILTVCLAVLGFQRYQDHRDRARAQEEALRYMAAYQLAKKRDDDRLALEFQDQATISAIPHAYPRPPSEWFTREKQFYGKILTGGQYEVVVAPLQVNGWGFDRATRSLMTAELVTAVAKSQPGKVPDAYLVAKALGEGQRQFPQAELYGLAKSVGAKRIVWGAVGHDLNGKMAITILSQLRPKVVGNDAMWHSQIDRGVLTDITFDAQHSPIEAFEARIPELLKSIGMTPPAAADQTIGKLDVAALPDSPLGLITADDNPARDAYAFSAFRFADTRAHGKDEGALRRKSASGYCPSVGQLAGIQGPARPCLHDVGISLRSGTDPGYGRE